MGQRLKQQTEIIKETFVSEHNRATCGHMVVNTGADKVATFQTI